MSDGVSISVLVIVIIILVLIGVFFSIWMSKYYRAHPALLFLVYIFLFPVWFIMLIVAALYRDPEERKEYELKRREKKLKKAEKKLKKQN